jgi:hypothetical protein
MSIVAHRLTAATIDAPAREGWTRASLVPRQIRPPRALRVTARACEAGAQQSRATEAHEPRQGGTKADLHSCALPPSLRSTPPPGAASVSAYITRGGDR